MKILVVIAPKNYRDEELFEPLNIFKKNNIDAEVVSTTKGEHTGMLGGKITTTMNIDEINEKDYDGIVIVGGSGSKKYLWNNDNLINLVKSFYENNKIVSAICISPAVLAISNILKNKQATVFPSNDAIEELLKGGAIYVDEGVVVDKTIITAKNPDYATDFGIKIVELLNKK